MKKNIFIILLLFLSTNIFGQNAIEGKWLAKDKVLHFSFSMVTTMLAVQTAYDYPKIFKNPELTGLVVGFGVGIVKEIWYDYPNGSHKDLVVDFAGCVSGVLVNRFTNKQIQKYYKKKGWL